MKIFLHEWKRGWKSFLIWTIAMSLSVFGLVIIYPQFQDMMAGLDDLIAGMGAFGAAFGLQYLSLSDPIAYYGLEVGNVLGIGGSIFAALLGSSMLAKEEANHTSDFLLTLPLTRTSLALQKLLAVITQIIAFNLANFALGAAAFAAITDSPDWRTFTIYHLGLLLMMLQIGILCYGISGFLRDRGLGLGIGLTLILYGLNLVSNLSENAQFFRYITPFAFAEASTVLPDKALNPTYLLSSMGIALVVALAGTWYYSKKDLAV